MSEFSSESALACNRDFDHSLAELSGRTFDTNAGRLNSIKGGALRIEQSINSVARSSVIHTFNKCCSELALFVLLDLNACSILIMAEFWFEVGTDFHFTNFFMRRQRLGIWCGAFLLTHTLNIDVLFCISNKSLINIYFSKMSFLNTNPCSIYGKCKWLNLINIKMFTPNKAPKIARTFTQLNILKKQLFPFKLFAYTKTRLRTSNSSINIKFVIWTKNSAVHFFCECIQNICWIDYFIS